MSDTPRTDAAAFLRTASIERGQDWNAVEANFARLLERENQQFQREVESSKAELKLLVAGLKGALYGLSTHPVTVDFQGFCISEKSKEKLSCIHEMIARYEQP